MGLYLLQSIEYERNDAERLVNLGLKRPYRFYFVGWNTLLEPPCKRCGYLESMLSGSPRHTERGVYTLWETVPGELSLWRHFSPGSGHVPKEASRETQPQAVLSP